MKFGMPSLIEIDSLEQNMALCRKLGLSFIEINMNLPLFQISELKALRFLSDIEFTLHLPEELNVWDFNDIIREAYLKILENTIKIAVDKNIKILNMHMNPGIYFTLPNQKVFLFKKYRGKYLENTRLFAEKVSEMLRKTQITVCIENTGIYDNDFILESLEQLLKHDCFKLTWDTGHDYSSGNKDTAYIKEHSDKLRHLHLHDAAAHGNHLPLGAGDLNIEEILAEARDYVERVVLETKTGAGLKQSVKYLKERKLIA
jgi:sugar phosphate isomerase/epimerase